VSGQDQARHDDDIRRRIAQSEFGRVLDDVGNGSETAEARGRSPLAPVTNELLAVLQGKAAGGD